MSMRMLIQTKRLEFAREEPDAEWMPRAFRASTPVGDYFYFSSLGGYEVRFQQGEDGTPPEPISDPVPDAARAQIVCNKHFSALIRECLEIAA
jgi:hypothetical protein